MQYFAHLIAFGIKLAIFAHKYAIYYTFMGIIIRERRIMLGLTQQELADYAGTSLRLIVSLENNKANPSLKALKAIAAVLGMEVTLKIKNIEL